MALGVEDAKFFISSYDKDQQEKERHPKVRATADGDESQEEDGKPTSITYPKKNMDG